MQHAITKHIPASPTTSRKRELCNAYSRAVAYATGIANAIHGYKHGSNSRAWSASYDHALTAFGHKQ